MKTSRTRLYVILLAICVAIITIVVALTKGKEIAFSVMLAGIGVVVGLALSAFLKKGTAVGKAAEELNPKAQRRLVTFLVIGAVLTMVGIVLLVLYMK